MSAARTPWHRFGRVVLWSGVTIAAASFAYKIVEFVLTLDSPEAPGFAMVPVIAYFIVATSYAMLFLWAYVSGQFAEMEKPKDLLLKREAELDRAEEIQARGR